MDMTDEKAQLGYWLGVAQEVGSVLTSTILTEGGQPISRSMVQHVTREDLLDPKKQERFQEFDAAVRSRLRDNNFHTVHDEIDLAPDVYLSNQLADDGLPTTPPDAECGNQWGANVPEYEDIVDGAEDPEIFDEFINAEITMHNEGEPRRGKIVKRARGIDGNPIGRRK